MNEGDAPDSPPSIEEPDFLLRWRGRTSGPFRLDEIEALLARRDISPLHEALCNGRWIQVCELLAKGDGFGFENSPLPTGPAPLLSPAGEASHDGFAAGERFHLRWKGTVLGPFAMDEIERRLDSQEIGMLHEIAVAGRWMSLEEFFVQRNVTDARERHALPGMRRRGPPTKFGARIVLYQVARTLKTGTTILDDINLVIEPNEFVALLGPSGSGKSTLMNAMTGRQPASRGIVTLNGEDFYANSAKYRRKIGYVPQKDIVHLTLDVQQTLTYAAQLRLPASVGRENVAQRVADVVRQIGLQERTRTRNSELSGGQLKRVSLGVELLSDPELLFLDEATSGLDAGTEARMMSLFRRLADDGRTVVCITHNLENVSLCDLVAVLVGGRLAYYGPTAELVTYLGVRKISQIYDRLETRTPEQWARQYEASAQYQKYVAERLKLAERGARHPASPLPAPDVEADTAGGWRQFLILTRRYFAVTLQDRRNVLLLLIQAPIIALLLGVVFHGKSFDDGQIPDIRKTLGFLLVVSAIWFGCINAAREIVKELPIYLRERAVSLNLPAYLGSKIVVLTLLCVIQCATLLSITLGLTSFRPDLVMQSGTLLLTSMAAMLMGLVISAVVKTEDKAMAIVPVLLIPQVIFSGAILDLSRAAELLAKWTIVAFWSFDAMLHSLAHSEKLNPQPYGNYGEDMVTIAMFIVVFAYLAAYALKRKDPLK